MQSRNGYRQKLEYFPVEFYPKLWTQVARVVNLVRLFPVYHTECPTLCTTLRAWRSVYMPGPSAADETCLLCTLLATIKQCCHVYVPNSLPVKCRFNISWTESAWIWICMSKRLHISLVNLLFSFSVAASAATRTTTWTCGTPTQSRGMVAVRTCWRRWRAVSSMMQTLSIHRRPTVCRRVVSTTELFRPIIINRSVGLNMLIMSIHTWVL